MHTSKTLEFIDKRDNLPPSLELDGKSLTISHIHGLSLISKVTIKEECRIRMQKNVDFFHKKLNEGACIYGVNTGYGGSADVRSADVTELQRSLVRHLNAGFGDTLPPALVRAVMLVRANSLSLGYSGVRPAVADLLLTMLAADLVPVVPKRGSVSASGDLMPTSYIAAVMMGREDAKVTLKGEPMLAPQALERLGLTPIVFQEKEALAVINAGSFASALAASVLYESNIAALLTQVATAMCVEALNGRAESFHATIHACLPHPGQQEVAANLRRLLGGSRLVADPREHQPGHDTAGSLKQDRYALRSSPQWLGPVLETLLESARRVTTEMNSANDNPLVDHEAGEILHGANFQAVSVTVAMDQARQALQLCGKLLFGQMQELTNVAMSKGLPPNLAGSDVRTDFGLKGADTAMAAYCSELDLLTAPLTAHVLSAELHNQSVNSMGLVSARYSADALDLLQMMLSNLLVAAAQALDLRWLQAAASAALEDCRLPQPPPHPALWPWYQFAFTPRDTTCRFLDSITAPTNGLDKEAVVERVGAVMDVLMARMARGEHVAEVAALLGQGTRRVYALIRSRLKVPFNTGNQYPDVALQAVFTAIKDQTFSQVLKDIFSTNEHS